MSDLTQREANKRAAIRGHSTGCAMYEPHIGSVLHSYHLQHADALARIKNNAVHDEPIDLRRRFKDVTPLVKKVLRSPRHVVEPVVLPPTQEPLVEEMSSGRADKLPPTIIKTIKEMVAKEFDVSVALIDSDIRDKWLYIPRHVAMYLAREHTDRSYPEIGRRMGGRDHSSVVHAFQKMPSRMIKDPRLCQTVVDLEEKIEQHIAEWRSAAHLSKSPSPCAQV